MRINYLTDETGRRVVDKAEFDAVVADQAVRSHTTRACDPPFTTFWADDECQNPVAMVRHPYDPSVDETVYYVAK